MNMSTYLNLRSLTERVFRTSPHYELVLYDHLSEDEQELLQELLDDPDFYGVLRPTAGSGRTIKAVDRETALLLLTLREPGPLPGYIFRSNRSGVDREISELLMGGVLELRNEDAFESGPEAFAHMQGATVTELAEQGGALARLSLSALRCAAASQVDEVQVLAHRLYTFNQMPLSPRWAHRFPDRLAVARYLGCAEGDALQARLQTGWREHSSDSSRGWIEWTRKTSGKWLKGSRGPTYKLYLSPRIEAVQEVFEVLTVVLAAHPAHAFKVGDDAYGLLRPDKMVVYFSSLEELANAAGDLADCLKDVPAHGVPFTAEIGGEGLLSWGMDPPLSEQVLSWRQRESWRLWVTHRLAAAMLEAKCSGSGTLPPWQYAMERLRTQGVDVERWTPSATIWRPETATGGRA